MAPEKAADDQYERAGLAAENAEPRQVAGGRGRRTVRQQLPARFSISRKRRMNHATTRNSADRMAGGAHTPSGMPPT